MTLPCLYSSQSRNYQSVEKMLSLLLLFLWAPLSEEIIILTKIFEWKFQTTVHKQTFTKTTFSWEEWELLCSPVDTNTWQELTLFRTKWDTWHYPNTSLPPFPTWFPQRFPEICNEFIELPSPKTYSIWCYCLSFISYFGDGIKTFIMVL